MATRRRRCAGCSGASRQIPIPGVPGTTSDAFWSTPSAGRMRSARWRGRSSSSPTISAGDSRSRARSTLGATSRAIARRPSSLSASHAPAAGRTSSTRRRISSRSSSAGVRGRRCRRRPILTSFWAGTRIEEARMKALLALVLLAAFAVAAHAGEVYRWVEGETVVYSDRPPQDGVVSTAMPAREALPVATVGAITIAPIPSADRVVSAAPATVDEILELSGARVQLGGLAASLGAGYLLPRRHQLDARDGALVARIIAQHFAPERFFVAIHDELGRRAEREQLDAMAAWFRSALGRRVSELEIAASKPEAAPAAVAFAERLKTSPAAPARLELVQRLDWVTGVSTDTTDLAMVIVRTGARAAATAAAADHRIRAGLVERRVEEMRGQMAERMGNMALMHTLYVYSALTDAELAACVAFLACPAARVSTHISHAALLRAVRDAADRPAPDIMRPVPPQRWAAAAQKISGPPGP